MELIIGYLITGIVSFLVGLALQRFSDKPNLKYFLPGNFLFELTDPQVTVRTDSLTLQNFGRKAATNVEIIHKEKPDHFQFYQAVEYTEAYNPNGEHLTKIASIGPKEYINIQYLSHTKLPVLLNIRSNQGPAKLIHVQFQPKLPKTVQCIAAALMLFGLVSSLYWLVAGISMLLSSFGVAVA